MGKAKVISNLNDEDGLFQVQIIYDDQNDRIRYIEGQQEKIKATIKELQEDIEDDITEEPEPDPEEEDPDPEKEDPDPPQDDDPEPDPDPPEPDPPIPDPPPEESGSIGGHVRGFI